MQIETGKRKKKKIPHCASGRRVITARFFPVAAQFHPHERLEAEDPEQAQRDHQDWFQIISFLTPTASRPLSIICLQLGDGVLAALISLTGIIAVMTSFAGNTDRRVKTSTISD